MYVTYLKKIIVRDLQTLRQQIEAYPDENQLWESREGVSNTGGTLALHLVGNLQHFIGGTLGTTGYQRDRSAEFADRNVPREKISARIGTTIDAVSQTLDVLEDDRLTQPYPLVFGDVTLETGQFLVHLTSHLSYHLGQIDYHRRLVTGINETVGGAQIAALA